MPFASICKHLTNMYGGTRYALCKPACLRSWISLTLFSTKLRDAELVEPLLRKNPYEKQPCQI